MLLALLLAACSRHPAAEKLSQDVYIWQRQYPGPAHGALCLNAQVARWHVLAAELGASGRWIDIAPDAEALANTGRPLIMTVRINGQLARLRCRLIRTICSNCWPPGASAACSRLRWRSTTTAPRRTARIHRLPAQPQGPHCRPT
jgi:hypothetical protein